MTAVVVSVLRLVEANVGKHDGTGTPSVLREAAQDCVGKYCTAACMYTEKATELGIKDFSYAKRYRTSIPARVAAIAGCKEDALHPQTLASRYNIRRQDLYPAIRVQKPQKRCNSVVKQRGTAARQTKHPRNAGDGWGS